MTQPLPPTREDPAIERGYALQSAYTDAVAAARMDTRASDLAIAENLQRIHDDTVQQLVAARDDYDLRRRARVADLEQVIPVGPNIPDDVDPADAAVLHSAFRTALTAARDADRDGRLAMLLDAERFGDDVQLRAVLTAAVDDSQQDIVDRWAARHPELLPQLRELVELRTDHMYALWRAQAFTIPPLPPEVADLPQLQAAAAQTASMMRPAASLAHVVRTQR